MWKGYHYLLTAIPMVLQNSEISITKEVYPYVAEVHNSTSGRVERDIRYALRKAFDEGGFSGNKDVFDGKLFFKEHPTSKEFIKRFAELFKSYY